MENITLTISKEKVEIIVDEEKNVITVIAGTRAVLIIDNPETFVIRFVPVHGA